MTTSRVSFSLADPETSQVLDRPNAQNSSSFPLLYYTGIAKIV